jgi:membrane glycosyltransferase
VSIPLSVFSSRVSQGRATRRDGYFLIPEELYPPDEIQRASDLVADTPELPGFAAAVADPAANALTCAIANTRAGQAEALRRERMGYAERALTGGPDALSTGQKLVLMSDPVLFSRLHAEVVRHPEAARAWHEAIGARQ